MASIIEGDFEWDDAKAAANLTEHKVTFEEAATVFDDPRAVDAPDLEDDERFMIIGQSSFSRMLFVVHCERGDRVRIISARVASLAQRRVYDEGT